MAEFESAHGTVTSSGLDGFDDVAVGHWTDAAARTGVTVVVLPEGSIGSAEVRGVGVGCAASCPRRTHTITSTAASTVSTSR